LVFQCRFGAVLPDGVSRTTNVIAMSWLPPPGVPKTYRRQIRESFGCYYPELGVYGNWWNQFPKSLDDVLAEYGAQVQDGELVDASGRNIWIMKKLRGGSRMRWDDDMRRGKKLPGDGQDVILVVDVEEDE
jgi:hypothetical protein